MSQYTVFDAEGRPVAMMGEGELSERANISGANSMLDRYRSLLGQSSDCPNCKPHDHADEGGGIGIAAALVGLVGMWWLVHKISNDSGAQPPQGA